MADKLNNCLKRIRATEKCSGNKTVSLEVISNRHRNEISSHCYHCSPPVFPLSTYCVSSFKKNSAGKVWVYHIFFFWFCCTALMCIYGIVEMKWILSSVCGCIDSLAFNRNTPHLTIYEKCTRENRYPDISCVCTIYADNTFAMLAIPIQPLNYMVYIKRFSELGCVDCVNAFEVISVQRKYWLLCVNKKHYHNMHCWHLTLGRILLIQ